MRKKHQYQAVQLNHSKSGVLFLPRIIYGDIFSSYCPLRFSSENSDFSKGSEEKLSAILRYPYFAEYILRECGAWRGRVAGQTKTYCKLHLEISVGSE